MRQTVLGVAAITLLAGFAGCGKEPGGPASTGPAGEGTGIDAQALLKTRCIRCHTLEPVEAHHFDRTGWEHTIDEMVGKGARLNSAERAAVIDLLTKRDAGVPRAEHHDDTDDAGEGEGDEKDQGDSEEHGH